VGVNVYDLTANEKKNIPIFSVAPYTYKKDEKDSYRVVSFSLREDYIKTAKIVLYYTHTTDVSMSLCFEQYDYSLLEILRKK